MTTIEEVPDGGGMDLGKLEGQGATSADDMELVRMGKKPRMKRIYNFWTRKIDCVPRTRIWLTIAVCAYQVMMCATWACKLGLISRF